MTDREVAARRHGVHEPRDEAGRVVRVGDEVHDREQHDRDRLVEVEYLRGPRQDELRVPQVGLDVAGGALGGAVEQRPGVQQHHRVVVHVDHAAVRRDRLRDLVHVLHGRQAGAEVEELPDAGLGGQETDHPGQKRPARPGRLHRLGEDLVGLFRGPPVGLEVVLAAQPVVVDPRRMGDFCIDPGWFGHDPDHKAGLSRVGDHHAGH
jgi:hypothetical protein